MSEIPAGYARCPKCDGTKIGDIISPEDALYGWNLGKTHYKCNNCGGQTMSQTALGYTNIDPATGLGCLHKYTGRTIGNCYHVYTCCKCPSYYDIDSGD